MRSYSLGVKINRKLYDEAQALYQRFIPLVLDYLEDVPGGQVSACHSFNPLNTSCVDIVESLE